MHDLIIATIFRTYAMPSSALPRHFAIRDAAPQPREPSINADFLSSDKYFSLFVSRDYYTASDDMMPAFARR